MRPRMNYEPTSPRVLVDIDRERAAALGVSVQAIGRTLEATMGARRVNTITDRGEEYYVYLQAERDERSDIADLTNKYRALRPHRRTRAAVDRGHACARWATRPSGGA